jgi:transposase-like protein
MKTDEKLPKTLREAVVYFSDEQRAFEFFVAMRWPEGVSCPHCHSSDVRFIPSRRVWNCANKHAGRQFSAKVGTIFADSPLGLDKWLPAFWMLTAAKNGVSSYEIHRALGVTQKTAWFMMHRIRVAIQEGTVVRDKMKGTVEVDESYIGGAARNMHHKAKVRRGLVGNSGINGKTIVLGILERGKDKKASRVTTEIVKDTSEKELMPHVRKYVLKGTELQTDALRTYRRAAEEYEHKVVDHAEAYVQAGVHTNGLENFWSLLKRTIRGTYVSVEPFHLFRYLSEQTFRFNERKNEAGDQGRFLTGMEGVVGRRLRYKTLIGFCEDGQAA